MKNFFTIGAEQQIRRLLREYGQEARNMAKEPFQVNEKGPEDYVTSIDRWLDRQLAAGFSQLFPEDGTITEENERSRLAFNAGYQRLWCIDPLDGTEAFIQGQQHYALMVGLLSDFEPIAGWIYAPATEQLYYGGADWGLFQASGERPVQQLPPVEPPAPSAGFCPMIIGDKDRQNFGEAIAQVIPEAQFYSLGSFGLKVMEVICGRAGLYIYMNKRVKLWDTTGPVALARAAGLVCCDLNGETLSFQPDAIAIDTLAHKQTIVIGWPRYVEALRSRLQEAVLANTND